MPFFVCVKCKRNVKIRMRELKKTTKTTGYCATCIRRLREGGHL